ncbi:MAG: protein kinase, partial [Pirellulaceae bacterium]
MSKTSPCQPQRVADFLNDNLSATDHAAFEQHLSECDACQANLLSHSASDNWWQAAHQFLSDDEWDAQAAALEETSAGPQRRGPSVSERYVIDSLAPTDNPSMLGRIGSYEVAGVIGSGGMGVVLKAWDGSLSRFVAIKVLSPHLAESEASRRRFAREAQAAAAVVHPNVIGIHGVAEANGLPYLVMSYEKGASLQKRLNQMGPLSAVEVLRIASQTAQGLAAAHRQGLVHRDIKPANLLLADGVERVVMTDFGLARAVDDASLTRTGIIAGTPQYMSPEQAAGADIDFRSDLFSLGSVMYAMCTGRPPFQADSTLGVLRQISESHPADIRSQNPTIPIWLCQIIQRLHRKDRNERFATAEEVADLLERCLAHLQKP